MWCVIRVRLPKLHFYGVYEYQTQSEPMTSLIWLDLTEVPLGRLMRKLGLKASKRLRRDSSSLKACKAS